MKILAPGQDVVLCEGAPGEPSTRIVGKIISARIFDDYSAPEYRVRWWQEGELYEDVFGPAELTPVDEPRHLVLSAE